MYLIDMEEAIQKMKEHRRLFCADDYYPYEFSKLAKDEKVRIDEIDNCIATLRNMKVAGIVKHGKWQRRKGADCWECSQCHAVLENEDLGMHNFYFCYHCGANMMDKCGYMDLEKANYE